MFHFLIVPALLLAAPAVAQDAATTSAATAMVDLINPPAQAKAGLDRQIAAVRDGQMIHAMLGNQPRFRTEAAKNQPAFNAAIKRMGATQAQALAPIFTDMQAASRRAAIAAYAKNFTAAELGQIMAFYKTPAGAKLLRAQPQITADVNRSVQAEYAPKIEAAQKSVAPKITAELKKIFPEAP